MIRAFRFALLLSACLSLLASSGLCATISNLKKNSKAISGAIGKAREGVQDTVTQYWNQTYRPLNAKNGDENIKKSVSTKQIIPYEDDDDFLPEPPAPMLKTQSQRPQTIQPALDGINAQSEIERLIQKKNQDNGKCLTCP